MVAVSAAASADLKRHTVQRKTIVIDRIALTRKTTSKIHLRLI